MLWEIDITPLPGQPDLDGQRVATEARERGIAGALRVAAARGYLVQGDITAEQIDRLATGLFSDQVVESVHVAQVGDESLCEAPAGCEQLLHVIRKPGVMDPVAQSAERAIRDMGVSVTAVRTIRKYWISALSADAVDRLAMKVLANDSIEQVITGKLELDSIELGSPYEFHLETVAIRKLSDVELEELSKHGQLYLTLTEMQTIQKHFQSLDRDPTDIELESVAQTWSEHCSHKTLAGRIAYRDERGQRQFTNMLKETIFDATTQIREQLGEQDWCVSVFEDNAGVIRFDDEDNVVFKVETHNHPSALEPYGGANTGIGGVIRDPLGTGMGAKPICNTDVFCFAPPDTPIDELPPGVLHPKRVMKGVVEGVRDYGNRMGIPTVNGAVYFDPRYLGNPLVYCGNVGILPRDKSFKKPEPYDFIVAIGGRTGRDGIHGATFSSAELTSDSETLSGGAVQIGNAITEKMVMDVLLQARDQGLYNAVTDCGAGGFSSAVGEMGEKIGAEVWLDKAPLKYEGLSYTEIWISEAQERMVFAVSENQLADFQAVCQAEDVEAVVIGQFKPTGRLQLKYGEHIVGDISMEFLHDGRPPVVRDAVYNPPAIQPMPVDQWDAQDTLLRILSSLNVASKEWVIRQYDHEVQGGSVIKPLVGIQNDGPSDAAVVRPKLSSPRGIVVSCGMNPHYGDFDPYDMAASAIDEAIRNCVAVGADPAQIAILDNFCWGYTDRPETLGALVRAAIACQELSVVLGTPFISGKDSLNNEFSYLDESNTKQTIAIPSTLLISALGQVADVTRCVTMDLKTAGDALFLIGMTKNELGGSHFGLVNALVGGQAPQVDPKQAKATFHALHQAIHKGTVRACHDLSEGGLAVAAAEMAFAGGLGATLDLSSMPCSEDANDDHVRLFSESNTRFLVEVAPEQVSAFVATMSSIPHAHVGHVTNTGELKFSGQKTDLNFPIQELKAAWQKPLKDFA